MSLLWRCMVNLIKIHPSHVLWGSVFSTPTVTHVPTSYSNMLCAKGCAKIEGDFGENATKECVRAHAHVCGCVF